MSRKHKRKQDSFNRKNNKGINKKKEAVDLSKLRIRAGMAAVSALLILSPVVISAAGSIVNPAVQDMQENSGIPDSEQTGSPSWILADDSGSGNTAADTGSTLAADPQSAGTFPAYIDKEGTDTNETSTRLPDAQDDEVPETGKTSPEKDDEAPETGKTSLEKDDEVPEPDNASPGKGGEACQARRR